MRAMLAAVVTALVFPALAMPATLTATREGSELSYVAAPGEQNALRFGGDFDSEEVIVSDPGATISASGDCVLRDPHTAVCPPTAFVEVSVGDLDDTVTAPEFADYGSVRGGAGNDTLRWSPLGQIYGGPGNDVLTGFDEDTGVYGGRGADTFRGFATVSFDDHRNGVRVTIDGVANDGAPGERDNVLQTVRFVIGSRGPDVLNGNAGRQWLYGGAGDDRLIGRGARDVLYGDRGDDVSVGGPGNDEFRDFGGNDRLVAGPGRDVVRAGSGSDVIHARDGVADAVDGGDGRDRARVDGRDRVHGIERLV